MDRRNREKTITLEFTPLEAELLADVGAEGWKATNFNLWPETDSCFGRAVQQMVDKVAMATGRRILNE